MKESGQMIDEMEVFLHESMCIDGKVEFTSMEPLKIDGEPRNSMIFKINDKKRGQFYIAWAK